MVWQLLTMRLAKSYISQSKGDITMTYNEFLDRYCGCHEDAAGNRPCDNGHLCDDCMTDDMINLWKEVKDNDC